MVDKSAATRSPCLQSSARLPSRYRGTVARKRSVDPAARQALADLVDELTRSLESENLPTAELTHLAETTVHLGEALHHKQDTGVIGKAREALQQAVGKAEATPPPPGGRAGPQTAGCLGANRNLGMSAKKRRRD